MNIYMEEKSTLNVSCMYHSCFRCSFNPFWPNGFFTITGKYGTIYSDTMSDEKCTEAIEDVLNKIDLTLSKTLNLTIEDYEKIYSACKK